MAVKNTWTLLIINNSFAISTVMAGIRNGSAVRLIKIRRIGLVNAQTAAVSGIICLLDIRRYYNSVTWTAPTAFAAYPHDTTNGALVSCTTGYAGGATGGSGPDILRKLCWSSDEPTISIATVDEWETFIPINIIWDLGYGDSSNINPLTLRNGEMVYVYNNQGATGLVDVWIEFTDEAV